MKSDFTRIVLFSVGIALVFVGILGLFLPIIQGLLTIILGIYVLTLASDSFKQWFERHIVKHPRAHHHYKKGHEYMGKFVTFFRK